MMTDRYSYKVSIKSKLSDELINTYLLRPLAGLFVRALFHTPVTPNNVTVASIAAGFAAAVCYWQNELQIAGVLITLKDLLDSADGQLARAKNQFSRKGRFLDSIGDFVVDLAVFAAIGVALFQKTGDLLAFFWTFLGFAGITLRVSYHVFYQVSYLHLEGRYRENRIIEDVTEVDRQGDRVTLRLHRVFVAIYGWQDRLMARIDRWCGGGQMDESFRQRWYGDEHALRLSGLLGFGTELFLLMVCSVLDALEFYLFINIVVMNGVLAMSIGYRRWVLQRRLTPGGSS
ncbi:MAG: CDP-alcohol phosphatidyltransferase family protein [Ignavibacteriales bacterium]|nr:CDP-alcohol phosphatidyltransferase family protein [Ignavibacteriales bacterium]